MLVRKAAAGCRLPVSTSKFGIGDNWGRMTTPLGFLQVAQKIGDHAPVGAVFHNRRFTGEVLKPNAPGRDPITTGSFGCVVFRRQTRMLSPGAFTFTARRGKVHGRPASYGCIRMKSSDVAALYAKCLSARSCKLSRIDCRKFPRLQKFPRRFRRRSWDRSGILARRRDKVTSKRARAALQSDHA